MIRTLRAGFASAVAAVVLVTMAGVLTAHANRPESTLGADDADEIPESLPAIVRGPQTETSDTANAQTNLFFDDGTCESGIGMGARHTSMVEFDIPSPCTQPGFSIVQLTVRINTGTATGFTLRQSRTTAGSTASGTHHTLSSPISGLGSCPAIGFSTRVITTGRAGSANQVVLFSRPVRR